MSIKSVCVYCGSSSGTNRVFTEKAKELGQLFYQNGWQLVYGGGTTGLMGTVARAAIGPNNDGKVHGIIPDALVSKERNEDSNTKQYDSNMNSSNGHSAKTEITRIEDHSGTTKISKEYGKTTIVPDMHTRKRLMAKESDAFVAMPGGFGTIEEIMECITWSQLGIHNKPIVLFNIDGYYDKLLDFLHESINNGFVSQRNGTILQVATTPQEVIHKINNYVAPDGRFNLDWNDECDNK
ncbi:hypothetical protein RI543_003177 [Arxiozyma heterogenica]|uniref:Uncharacterized protein n=1 Tax=Arxiozyma heterogenica TaxID=278026 RepID=A0AAN7WPS6_9SACH|nr:hypothetical protein RI543_003177 [Kazachstania heterogenica]